MLHSMNTVVIHIYIYNMHSFQSGDLFSSDLWLSDCALAERLGRFEKIAHELFNGRKDHATPPN